MFMKESLEKKGRSVDIFMAFLGHVWKTANKSSLNIEEGEFEVRLSTSLIIVTPLQQCHCCHYDITVKSLQYSYYHVCCLNKYLTSKNLLEIFKSISQQPEIKVKQKHTQTLRLYHNTERLHLGFLIISTDM